MNERIFELFTAENIKSYSKACIDLSDMLNILSEEDYKILIVPSRGAYPFVNGAEHYEIMTSKVTRISERYYVKIKKWLLPFTADWGGGSSDINSKEVRLFWTKIIADTFNKENTIYMQLYKNIISDVGEYLTINTTELLLKPEGRKNDKFIFVDTAISGRAICEIIEGFHKNNLDNYYIILLIDDEGNSLKSNYLKIIENEKKRGKLFCIKVKKIFSEDCSPLLNGGISSIVFPNLIKSVFNSHSEFANSNCVGGGIWFIDSMSHLIDYEPILNGVRGSVASYIHMGLEQFIEDRKGSFFNDENFKELNYRLQQEIKNFNIFDQQNTKRLVYDRINKRNTNFKDEKKVDVSSSHVIRINFSDKYLENFIKKVKNSTI